MSSHRPVTRSQTVNLDRATKSEKLICLEATSTKHKRRQRPTVEKKKDAIGVLVQSSSPENCHQKYNVPPETRAIQYLLRSDRDLADDGLKDVFSLPKRRKGEVGWELLVWGDGSMGQLGLDESDEDPLRVYPMELAVSQRVKAVAAGGMHTLMLMEDGSLESFGSNDEGALGRKTIGDVWGIETATESSLKQNLPAKVSLMNCKAEVSGIRCSDTGCFVWTTDGRIYAWGSFRSSGGLMGFSPDVRIQKEPICIYEPPSLLKKAEKLAAGANHVLALLNDGSVLSWGNGERGQLGRCHPEEDSKRTMLCPSDIASLAGKTIVDIFCGDSVSFFKTADGAMFGCGMNTDGQLGIEPKSTAAAHACPTVESSVRGQTLFLKPTRIRSLSHPKLDVRDIAAGKRHTLVLTIEGEVYSFGSSNYGVLGRIGAETSKAFPIPERIPQLSDISCISAGQDCSACIDKQGRMYTFGGEHSGLICVGSDGDDILKPQRLVKGKAAKTFVFSDVDFGGQHGILLGKKRIE